MPVHKEKHRIQYYDSLQDDFVEIAGQKFTLPDDYVWIHSGRMSKIARAVLYALSHAFARIYGTVALHLHVVRNVDLHDFRNTGAVLYGNHTQPLGDVFTPTLACAPKRCYSVASTANLSLPVLGKMLPVMGALPVPENDRDMIKFLRTVRQRLQEGNCIIVYPEAHVWPYYTEIRPFSATSFTFAVQNHVPAFSMTTTYQSRRHGRPKTTLFLDGPFYADASLSEQKQKEQLRDMVFEQMCTRSRESTCRYIEYRPRGEKESVDP